MPSRLKPATSSRWRGDEQGAKIADLDVGDVVLFSGAGSAVRNPKVDLIQTHFAADHEALQCSEAEQRTPRR
jgi:hypothetical protein